MFDYMPTTTRRDPLILVRKLLFNHGSELAEAALCLGGPSAESKVRKCADRIEIACLITPRILSDLKSIHQVISLDHVGAVDTFETELFCDFDPGSREVEEICRLTDMLSDILQLIEASPEMMMPKAANAQTSAV